MSQMTQFVANYDDLSTDKGFQFKFHCDKCRNGYLSRFQPNAIGIAGSLLSAASSFFGGLGGVQNAAYQIQQAVGGTAHDKALETAVAEGKQNFKQCTRYTATGYAPTRAETPAPASAKTARPTSKRSYGRNSRRPPASRFAPKPARTTTPRTWISWVGAP